MMMEQAENRSMMIFKPKYSIGHWLQLAHIPAITAMPLAIDWGFGRMDREYWQAAGPEVFLAYGLLALLWVLEILIFLAGRHILQIRLDASGIEVLRPMGSPLRAAYSDAAWDSNRLTIFRHSYAMERVRNSADLVRLLPAETLQEKPKGQGWFRRLEASRWYNAIVVLAVLAIAGFILVWGILKLSGALNNLPEFSLRELNWLLALVDCAFLGLLVMQLIQPSKDARR